MSAESKRERERDSFSPHADELAESTVSCGHIVTYQTAVHGARVQIPVVEAVIEAVYKNVKNIKGVPWDVRAWSQQMQRNDPLKYYKNASTPVSNKSWTLMNLVARLRLDRITALSTSLW